MGAVEIIITTLMGLGLVGLTVATIGAIFYVSKPIKFDAKMWREAEEQAHEELKLQYGEAYPHFHANKAPHSPPSDAVMGLHQNH